MADIAATNETRAKTIDWSAAIWAGVVGGIVFVLLQMLLLPTIGGAPSPWVAFRAMGAVLLGSEVLPPPATFEFGIFIAAMLVHFPTSILTAIVTAFVIRKRSMGPAIGLAVLVALGLYVLAHYPPYTLAFPWFVKGRGWLSILIHVVFGAVVGWWYIAHADRVEGVCSRNGKYRALSRRGEPK